MVPLRRSVPYEQPKLQGDSAEVFHLEPGLVEWAYQLTKDVPLTESDQMKEELMRKAGRLDAEEADIAARRLELTALRREAEDTVNQMVRAALALKEQAPALSESYNEANEAIAGLEEAVKAARKEEDAARDLLSQAELNRAQLSLRMEHLTGTVMHNYHIEVSQIEEEIRLMELDRADAEVRAAGIREKLEGMGPVNVGAIEEYNELMERYNFLTSQKEDLESSVARLREAIGRINKTSEELFMEAFNSINETFKEVFTSLFEGGRAELLLTAPDEGADVLESGLEIVAQPPGKKLQNLTLCSGGEKALIAAALTFACFLVKPSPFCVLDEVDAPLDEANVQRFGRMLKEFADRTQFIVITHSRPTMEIADALYGVTMDEPGVSSLVSVRLKEAAGMAHA